MQVEMFGLKQTSHETNMGSTIADLLPKNVSGLAVMLTH